jgi:hypothetical protein
MYLHALPGGFLDSDASGLNVENMTIKALVANNEV